MIKLSNLDRFESMKNAQSNVGAYRNYLSDVLKPAIERGNWDEFENLDIGFTVTGESLGKVGNNDAWKNLQLFFEPNATKTSTIDFTLKGSVIERNLRNQLKSLVLRMMWLSSHNYSFLSISNTVNSLKKIIPPLLSEGFNSFEYLNFYRLESWMLTDSTDIDFERASIYNGLNKLFTEARALPFRVTLKKILNASDFGLALKDSVQYNVIPQRLYYLGLKKSEELTNELYPLRNEIGKLLDYITTYLDILYQGYAEYLINDKSKTLNGKIKWLLRTSKKSENEKAIAFKEAFLAIKSPIKNEIIDLLESHKPEIHSDHAHKFHHNLALKIGGREITSMKGAISLFGEFSGGCLWGLMSRTGMRADEVYCLHTVKGSTTEIISKQIIYIIHADLSKTVRGCQSKQDEFVTTEVGKKAYEILQALHKPLRKLHPESKNFFHKIKEGFSAITKGSF